MHPKDALRRGICDGDAVRLVNRQGLAELSVQLSDDLTPGVVCLPEGVWVEMDESGVDKAGSANMLTSTEGTKPGKACIMHGVAVEVQKVSG
jgi:anaerobic selenocysteine-containing dehydrogenase